MKDRHQVMRSLSLPLALSEGQKNCGSKSVPQYKIDFSAKYRLKPSFGLCKGNNIFLIKNLEFNTVPTDNLLQTWLPVRAFISIEWMRKQIPLPVGH